MLIRHSIVYVVAKIVPGALGMATTALLTRLLTPGEYGVLGLALVVMTFGSTMAFDWLGLAFLRVYQSRRGDPRVVSTFVQMFAGLALMTAVLAGLAWAAGLFTGIAARAYGIGIVMMWCYAWFELVARFEVAAFRPVKYLAMNVGRAVFALGGAGAAAWLWRDPVAAAAGMAAGMLGGALLGGAQGWRLGRQHFDPALARMVLAFGLPLAASLAMSSMIMSGTRAMVQWLSSMEALGLYTAAFMLVQNTVAVAAAGIASAGYSLAVRAVESGDGAAAQRQLLANGALMLAVLSPVAVGMALTAHGIATTLVGPAYVGAVAGLTPWMAGGAFLGSLRAHYLDHAFQLGERPNLQVGVTAVAAAVAVAGSLWLIPVRGPVGAAMAVAAAMAVSCVHATVVGRRAYPVPLPLAAAWRVAMACAVMAACVWAVPGDGVTGFVAQMVVGGISYAAAALGLDILGARRAFADWVARSGRRRLTAS